MADPQQPEHSIPLTLPSAPFPAPPPFWNHFTTAQVAHVEEFQSSGEEIDLSKLPVELRCLIPPAPPSEDTPSYTTFHLTHSLASDPTQASASNLLVPASLLKTLENIPPLLKSLTRSIMLNFLELITILANNPSFHAPKLSDIETLFRNVHSLINLYRPHQAREAVIGMLEDLVDKGKREVKECEDWMARVEAFLKEVENGTSWKDGSIANETTPNGADNKAMREEEDGKRLWRMIYELDVNAES